MSVQSSLLVLNSIHPALESIAHFNTYFSMTYLHALAQPFCDIKDIFALTAPCMTDPLVTRAISDNFSSTLG